MFDDVVHAHLIGAGGIGISAVGKWLLSRGVHVSGSDAVRSLVTDDLAKRGATVAIGHAVGNIPAECNLVVYTEAANEDNVERVEAARRGIRSLGHFDFLGELSKTMRTICITGTHGKSTTTAMTGKIFEAAGLDPTVFVGSLVPGWELGNLRIGKSDILIVEGDEYKRKMLALHPETTVITNIELDHTDIYKAVIDLEAAFHQLVEQTSGAVIISTDLFDRDIACGHNKTTVYDADGFGTLRLHIPGAFNMMNARAARAVALEYGMSEDVIKKTLSDFTGIWRRFERVGLLKWGQVLHSAYAEVISDYAHHPTAIRATLAAAKEFFPGRRIVVCFQPHQHNRTKELFDDFVTAFSDADVLVLAEIYGVKGRTEDASISSADLLSALHHPHATYAATLADAEAQLRAAVEDGDVVIVMGAGDIDDVARRLVT